MKHFFIIVICLWIISIIWIIIKKCVQSFKKSRDNRRYLKQLQLEFDELEKEYSQYPLPNGSTLHDMEMWKMHVELYYDKTRRHNHIKAILRHRHNIVLGFIVE